MCSARTALSATRGRQHAGCLLQLGPRRGCDRGGMSRQPDMPGWVVPAPVELRDLVCLAFRHHAAHGTREAAGIVAVAGWLRGQQPAPVTARSNGAEVRDVALVELCAAECLVDDGRPPPPLHDVCQLLEVAYRKPVDVDPGFARGVWLALRWVLGQESRPPLDLPIRRPDGAVMGEVEIYAELVSRGEPAPTARAAAKALAADSLRLAALVEETAANMPDYI